MMTSDESDPARDPPNAPRSAEATCEKTNQQRAGLGGGPSIWTPEEAIHGLQALSREARALQAGLRRLSAGKEFKQSPARQHLLVGQKALEHAAAVFETVASLLESK
jgi:hypothetical protein